MTGSGMQFAGSNPTGDITISSANPSDSSDTPRFIEFNSKGGIVFLGPNEGFPATNNLGYIATGVGVTLDDVLVQNNAGYSVVLDNVTNDTTRNNPETSSPYIGFINNSCISGNLLQNQASGSGDVPSAFSLLSSPTPGSYPGPSYSTYRGGACPTSMAPLNTPKPAESMIPGWVW
jgi:hypothetical protein